MLLNIIKNRVSPKGFGSYVRNLLHNLLAVVSDLVQWASDIRLHAAGTCQHRVSTLCLCICVGLHPCLFLTNGAWRDYADSVYNRDTGTVIAQVCVSARVRVRPRRDVLASPPFPHMSNDRWSGGRSPSEWKHSGALFVLCAKGKHGGEPLTNPLLPSLI